MNERKYGKWFKGNIFLFNSAKIIKCKKYETGVKKPTALETKTTNGKTYSRYYYKPIGENEFFD